MAKPEDKPDNSNKPDKDKPPTETAPPPTEVVEPPPEVVEPPPEVVEPPPPSAEGGTIPLSFDDPMFTGMTEKSSCVHLSSGQNLNNHSIQETSGEPSVVCIGNNALSHIRVKSRECIRITDNDLTIENAYLEAQGTGDDHADTLQAYCPGAHGAVTLRNVHVRAHNEAATAGYFTADYWSGTITCENVIFQGGPFGIRANSDTDGHIDVYMKNVFFVGPFGYEPFLFGEYGGTITIHLWENVRHATIENGKLVPGTAINNPSAAEMAAAASKAPPPPVRNASTGYTIAK